MDFEFNVEVKSRWVSHETFWETGEEGVKGYAMKAGIVISISLWDTKEPEFRNVSQVEQKPRNESNPWHDTCVSKEGFNRRGKRAETSGTRLSNGNKKLCFVSIEL